MIEGLFQDPYRLSKSEKTRFLMDQLAALNDLHANRCEPYGNMLRHVPFHGDAGSLDGMPYLPVQLFKMADWLSVPKDQIIKTLTSSGTTSQQVSKIYIDRETSLLQTKALASIVSAYIGKRRLPMIIVDSKAALQNRKAFSARGAGIVGFSTFGKDHFYLLDEQMEPDWNGLHVFLEKHKDETVLLFGFTYMVWKYFYQASMESGTDVTVPDGVLIHGGGWKKLKEESVGNDEFKKAMRERFGLRSVHNYYGMVEQVGSIFMECEDGFLHAPDFADILIRNMDTLQSAAVGERGIIQAISVLPRSYPGHSVLTEDIGMIAGEDDCACGRQGKYFLVEGRLPKAEIRGCSDTLAYGGSRLE